MPPHPRLSQLVSIVKRILVIGSGGAGKSVLARRITVATGLPLIHLDALYWHPGWVETPKDEWARVVAELITRDAWVMDGNYSGTLDARLRACDVVIFLDYPRWQCVWGVIERRLRFTLGENRTDVPSNCPERLTWEFLRWIWDYPTRTRPKVLEKLRAAAAEKRVVILRSRAEAERFIASLGALPATAGTGPSPA